MIREQQNGVESDRGGIEEQWKKEERQTRKDMQLESIVYKYIIYTYYM